MAHDIHNDCDRGNTHNSNKYSGYIKENFAAIKEKCSRLQSCIDKLYANELTTLIGGGDIGLKKICNLIKDDEQSTSSYTVGSTTYNVTVADRCTAEEKKDIREHLEKEGGYQPFLKNNGQWNNIRRCLENQIGDKNRRGFVEDVCHLVSKGPRYLCRKESNHRAVKSYFNAEIRDLKCDCHNLSHLTDDQSSSPPMKAIIGGCIAGGLLLIIFILIGCICYHRRKRQKKKKRSPNVIYLPAPNSGDNFPIYQEVVYDRGSCSSPTSNPPTLPARYTGYPPSHPRPKEDEQAYLEPIEAGSMRSSVRPRLPARPHDKNNPYELAKNPDGYYEMPPPKYTERPEDQTDNPYFEPIPTPPESPLEETFDSIDDSRVTAGPVTTNLDEPPQEEAPKTPQGSFNSHHSKSQQSSVKSTNSSKAQQEASTVDAPEEDAFSKPLGPVPAERTKKEDRENQSHYFELEKLTDGD